MNPWKIYYGDRTTFSGEPENAPCQSDPIGWHRTNKFTDRLQHLGLCVVLSGVRVVLCGDRYG